MFGIGKLTFWLSLKDQPETFRKIELCQFPKKRKIISKYEELKISHTKDEARGIFAEIRQNQESRKNQIIRITRLQDETVAILFEKGIIFTDRSEGTSHNNKIIAGLVGSSRYRSRGDIFINPNLDNTFQRPDPQLPYNLTDKDVMPVDKVKTISQHIMDEILEENIASLKHYHQLLVAGSQFNRWPNIQEYADEAILDMIIDKRLVFKSNSSNRQF